MLYNCDMCEGEGWYHKQTQDGDWKLTECQYCSHKRSWYDYEEEDYYYDE